MWSSRKLPLHCTACTHTESSRHTIDPPHPPPPLLSQSNSEGAAVFSARVLLALLDEARGVPVVFAVLLSSGQVVLQVMLSPVDDDVDDDVDDIDDDIVQ